MQRVLGEVIPISIPTARAVESLLGLGEDFQTKDPHVGKITQLWVNLRTLVRNALNSHTTQEQENMEIDYLVDAVIQDIQVMEESVISQSTNPVSMVVYFCRFNRLDHQFPKALIKQINTDKQRYIHHLETETIKAILDADRLATFDFKQYDLKITGQTMESVAMVTHLPVDLLNRYEFGKLWLLESHTGAIKGPMSWHTRLQGISSDVTRIPFNRAMLQIFGDKVMFSPMPIKIRRFILDLAEKKKWTQTTSKDLIMKCVRDERDPVLEALFMRLW